MQLYTALVTFFFLAAAANVAEDVILSISDLNYDENGKLAKHTGELVTVSRRTLLEFKM